MNAFDLRSKFGMSEMEEAAAIIIQGCLKYNHLEQFSPKDFQNKPYEALVGFVELIYNGWLIHSDDYHATFWPSDAFIERVEPYLPLEWRGTQNTYFPTPSPEDDEDD